MIALCTKNRGRHPQDVERCHAAATAAASLGAQLLLLLSHSGCACAGMLFSCSYACTLHS